jgi:hypothetical protein
MKDQARNKEAREWARAALGGCCSKCGETDRPRRIFVRAGAGHKYRRKSIMVSSLHGHHTTPVTEKATTTRIGNIKVPAGIHKETFVKDFLDNHAPDLVLLCEKCHKEQHMKP